MGRGAVILSVFLVALFIGAFSAAIGGDIIGLVDLRIAEAQAEAERARADAEAASAQAALAEAQLAEAEGDADATRMLAEAAADTVQRQSRAATTWAMIGPAVTIGAMLFVVVAVFIAGASFGAYVIVTRPRAAAMPRFERRTDVALLSSGALRLVPRERRYDVEAVDVGRQ